LPFTGRRPPTNALGGQGSGAAADFKEKYFFELYISHLLPEQNFGGTIHRATPPPSESAQSRKNTVRSREGQRID